MLQLIIPGKSERRATDNLRASCLLWFGCTAGRDGPTGRAASCWCCAPPCRPGTCSRRGTGGGGWWPPGWECRSGCCLIRRNLCLPRRRKNFFRMKICPRPWTGGGRWPWGRGLRSRRSIWERFQRTEISKKKYIKTVWIFKTC